MKPKQLNHTFIIQIYGDYRVLHIPLFICHICFDRCGHSRHENYCTQDYCIPNLSVLPHCKYKMGGNTKQSNILKCMNNS